MFDREKLMQIGIIHLKSPKCFYSFEYPYPALSSHNAHTLRCLRFGTIFFTTSCHKSAWGRLTVASITGLRNTKCTSCWPQAAKATNETYARKPLACAEGTGINLNSQY